MLQALKQWLVYYIHDETYLGKALSAVAEMFRWLLQTILNTSDGSWAGDAFAVGTLFLVHLAMPMLLILLYYGLRLRQIKQGKITDPVYEAKAKKYFFQASLVMGLNIVLLLSYIGLPEIIRLFKPDPPPAKTMVAEPEKPSYISPKKKSGI